MNVRESMHVPARHGHGFNVKQGELIRITDLEGSQPVDFWAFVRDNIYEHSSPEHTKPSIARLTPIVGESLYTNHRRPIVTLSEDTSMGQHDMQFAACDRWRYLELGADESHSSCQDNFHEALASLGLTLPYTPQPWNLFTNFALQPDGTFEIRKPETQPGDRVVLRVDLDAYVVVSACPQDMNMTCGGNPTAIQVEVGG